MSPPTLAVLLDENAAHFIRLAQRARRLPATAAALPAKLLADTVIRQVPRLDPIARDGLQRFIDMVHYHPDAARALIQP